MDPVDNNQFEVVPTKSKRKIAAPCANVYLNPALDLLANEDPMCNTAMEIVPIKKPKISKVNDIAVFENSALDLGISKAAVNEFLIRELENVRKNLRNYETQVQNDTKEYLPSKTAVTEPIYANITNLPPIPFNNAMNPVVDSLLYNRTVIPLEDSTIDNLESTSTAKPDLPVILPTVDNSLNFMEASKITDLNETEVDSGISVLESKSINTLVKTDLDNNDLSSINNTTNIQTNITNQIFVNNTSNLNLSFIDRLALDSPSMSNQSLYLDDDLNESNIMEIKTITIITKKKRIPDKKKNTNPFLDPDLVEDLSTAVENPFLETDITKPELEYNDEVINRPVQVQVPQVSAIKPRRLFANETNSTISTVNESCIDAQNEYENIDDYRSDSPIYENVGDDSSNDMSYNKQSKILGYDVSQFSAIDIMNLNKNRKANSSNESNDSKRDLKHQFLKASNKLSKKVLKTLKKTFKNEKPVQNVTLNPYEVSRKLPKQKTIANESGIENFALKLDNSDEIEMEEIDDEDHQYETIKTLRNTRLNMNVTPLKEKGNENVDISHNKSNTPGKKVRFDSTLNQEKIITGNSFDCDIQSPGFDAKIEKYHDELENCINERKFLQQNM